MTIGKGNPPAVAADDAKMPKCPICGQPRDPGYRPFCSKRCADLDLGRWLNGTYAIPVSDDDDEDGGEGEGGDAQPRDRGGRESEPH